MTLEMLIRGLQDTIMFFIFIFGLLIFVVVKLRVYFKIKIAWTKTLGTILVNLISFLLVILGWAVLVSLIYGAIQ